MNHEVRPISESKYADVWQAAEYLHVSVACIRKWLTLGKLTRYRAGRRVLVRIEDLEALVVQEKPTISTGFLTKSRGFLPA